MGKDDRQPSQNREFDVSELDKLRSYIKILFDFRIRITDNIHIASNLKPDRLIWVDNKEGFFTVKSAFHHLKLQE